MKIKHSWLLAAGALLLAVATPATQAATVITSNSGGLLIGFRATGGTGAGTSYLINVGQALDYANATPGSTFVVSGLGATGTDLAATYGSTWYNRTEVQWGVFGAVNNANPTLYSSASQEPVGTPAPPWPEVSASNLRTETKNAIVSVQAAFNILQATANSTVAAFQTNSGGPETYAYQVGTAGVTDFGSASQWFSIEDNFGAGGAGTTALDLFRTNATGVTRLGTFTINNAGAISFTAASAVPEPSRAVLMAFGLMIPILRRRRHSVLAAK